MRRERGHIAATGSRSPASARSGSGCSGSASTRASGRRRCTSRPPRRRSSSCSVDRVSRCSGTESRRRPSRSVPVTASSTSRSSTRTRSRAGPDGIDVLAFGERHYAANTLLPRAGVSWLGPTWVLQGAPDDHPWAREAAAGPPTVGELSARPARIVNVADAPASERRGATIVTRLARPRARCGLAQDRSEALRRRARQAPERPALPHARRRRSTSSSTGPGRSRCGRTRARGRAGRVALRARAPPASRRLHRRARRPAPVGPLSFEAGPDGMQVLAYGMRRPNDIAYYPRSGKISFRGVGVIGRIEPLGVLGGRGLSEA